MSTSTTKQSLIYHWGIYLLKSISQSNFSNTHPGASISLLWTSPTVEAPWHTNTETWAPLRYLKVTGAAIQYRIELPFVPDSSEVTSKSLEFQNNKNVFVVRGRSHELHLSFCWQDDSGSEWWGASHTRKMKHVIREVRLRTTWYQLDFHRLEKDQRTGSIMWPVTQSIVYVMKPQ